MASSSGTYAFAPGLDDLLIEAYGRLQIRPSSFSAQHMRDAFMSANLLLAEFAVRGVPNLWEVELISIPLIQGTATYNIPKNIVAILDYYISTNTGTPTQTDIIVYPISRTDYAAQPNKNLQARPTTVWWDRLINSTITLWPVPDGAGPYTLFYYAMTQMQDAVLGQGTLVDVPYRFLEAFAAGLAAKLAIKYPPPPPMSYIILKQLADEAWTFAAQQDVEDTPWMIQPAVSSYYRD